MSNPIILPPLPEPAGTLVPPAMTAGSSWYSHGYTADQLRARDLEVARVVLKAAADLVDGNAAYCSEQTAAILGSNADAIRKMEVRHAE